MDTSLINPNESFDGIMSRGGIGVKELYDFLQEILNIEDVRLFVQSAEKLIDYLEQNFPSINAKKLKGYLGEPDQLREELSKVMMAAPVLQR